MDNFGQIHEDQPTTSLSQKAKAFRASIGRNSHASRKQLIGGLFVLGLAIGGISFAQRLVSPVGTPERSQAASSVPWTYPRSLKVLVLRYFDPASISQFSNPTNASGLIDSMKANLAEASKYHGMGTAAINVSVSGQYDFNGPAPTNADWNVAYKQMLTTPLPGDTKTACDRINAEGIDEVWFMGDPTVPGFVKGPETAISSKFLRHGPLDNVVEYDMIPTELFCGGQRSFIVLFFDLSKQLRGIHHFGHYLESVIGGVQGYDLFYKRFMSITYDGNGIDGRAIDGVRLPDNCGSIHVPPNVNTLTNTNPLTYKGYVWNSPNEEQSSCYNWKPDGTGQKTLVTANTWINSPVFTLGGSDELKYHVWWAQNLPNMGNSLTYNNLPLPNWWDFVVDTDNTIAYYLNSPFYMNPDLWLVQNSTVTASCTSSSGTTISCQGPAGGSTLGVATDSEGGQVLQATTPQYANIALVTLAYGVSLTSTAQATSVTYCGDAMQKLSRSALAGSNTEIWYKLSPKSVDSEGNPCKASATLSANPGQSILTSTIFNNVDSATPFVGTQTFVSPGGYSFNPGTISMSSTGPKDTFLFCVNEHYSEQSAPPGPNFATPTGETRQIWSFQDGKITPNGDNANIWSNIGVSNQRTADNVSKTISWSTVKTQAWSASCTNIKVKPFAPVTAPPAPIPSVDIKANNSNGPISVATGGAVTLSWSSANVSVCSASGAWTGTKGTSGSLSINPIASGTYSIVCTGPNNAQASDSVTINVTGQTLSFVLNDRGTIITDGGIIPVIGAQDVSFIWAYTGTATSCTALTTSAGNPLDALPKWSGTKAKTGNQIVSIGFGGPYTFKITCGTLSKSISVGTATPGTTPPPTPAPIPSPKPGLTGEYYDNENFTNLLFGRTDLTPNYNWDVGTPDTRIGVDTFSTRWTGTLKVPTTGSYIFYSTVDDGARIWIDNKLVLDKWGYSSHNGVETSTAAQSLTQGDHNIKIEYHEGGGKARISLLWSGPGITKQVVPSTALLNMIPLSASMGLFGNYYDNEDFTGTRVMRMDANINFDWGGGSPDTKLAVDTFSARWTGGLIVPTAGAYTFYGLLDDGMRVYVDEQLVFDKWGYGSHNGIEVAGAPVTLAAGNHSFRAEFHDGSGNARAMLSWSGPGITKQIIPPSSFINSYTAPLAVTGEYFNTENFTGTSITRVDPSINFNWSTNSPLAGINVDNFSVRWTGYIHTPAAGAYTFYTEVDDGIRVWVDGALVMDKWSWSSHSGAEQTSAAITLSAGTHALQVEQHEGGGGAKAIVRWKGPNISKQVLPIYLN